MISNSLIPTVAIILAFFAPGTASAQPTPVDSAVSRHIDTVTAGNAAIAATLAPRVESLDVGVSPAKPVQGSLIRLRVRPLDSTGTVISPDSFGIGVTGTLAGEPLHFEADGDSGFVAYAGIPVDAPDSTRVIVAVNGDSGAVRADTVQIAVAPGAFRMEKLTVAPKFGRAPDSALAARMARESRMAQAVSAASHDTPRLWEPPFVRPRPGRITSGFGNGREFNGVVQSRHTGTDFAGAIGAPVRAANRGVVAMVVDFHLAGNAIYVDHGAGLVTAYFHLSRADVAKGDTVDRGQVIGRVGATGRVTGPHLHWIARYGGISVNPVSLFAFGEVAAPAAATPSASKPATVKPASAKADSTAPASATSPSAKSDSTAPSAAPKDR